VASSSYLNSLSYQIRPTFRRSFMGQISTLMLAGCDALVGGMRLRTGCAIEGCAFNARIRWSDLKERAAQNSIGHPVTPSRMAGVLYCSRKCYVFPAFAAWRGQNKDDTTASYKELRQGQIRPPQLVASSDHLAYGTDLRIMRSKFSPMTGYSNARLPGHAA
jgi:hypothetical protein